MTLKDEIYGDARADWGWFRNYIRQHPLTGFWIGVAVGVLGGALIRGLF